MLLIMYGIIQVYRFYVRLATGPGGLKSTRILAPVAVRFSGRYKQHWVNSYLAPQEDVSLSIEP